MQDLQISRAQIDEIDKELCSLFERRMAVCQEVAAYKAANGLPVLDVQREREVLEAKRQLVKEPSMQPHVAALFETIMAQSRQLQARSVAPQNEKQETLDQCRRVGAWTGEPLQTCRVLYQGQPGAYGEEAAMAFFGADCERTNLKTWDGVFRGVKEGFCDFGVLPIENSSTGSINDVYDLLSKFGCYVVGEQIVRVEHCLMGISKASMKTVTDVYSHEQGLMQCRAFLDQYPKWAQHELTNTALAAKFVAESGDKTKAAIASRRAAELYGLQILQTHINENVHNYTRFIVVAAEPRFEEGANKISVSFTVAHTEGSLYRVLGVFARHGLNLMKLESRPIPEKSWEYCFFADFTGNLRDHAMDCVLSELIEETAALRILGNYRAAEL